MKIDLNRLMTDRVAQIISLIGLVLIVYAWTISRDLRALSERIAAAENAPEADAAPATKAPQISFETFDTVAVSQVGVMPEKPKEIVVSPHAALVIQPSPEPAPPELAAVPFPALKIHGIFIGDHVREVLVDLDGQKRRVPIGHEVNGWRLLEVDRNTAVFESPSGQRESLKLFPGMP